MGLLEKIKNRGQYYLPVFAQQATYLLHASGTLCEMMETMDMTKWRSLEKEIKACEVQGDALLTELHEQLSEKLIARIKKIDIQAIAMSMDELLDHLNDSAKSFHLYSPDRIDPQIADLAQSSVCLCQLLGTLRAEGRVGVACVNAPEVILGEAVADQMYLVGFHI